eukprot:3807839-Alexandrium_andersonii.AAC.1
MHGDAPSQRDALNNPSPNQASGILLTPKQSLKRSLTWNEHSPALTGAFTPSPISTFVQLMMLCSLARGVPCERCRSPFRTLACPRQSSLASA